MSILPIPYPYPYPSYRFWIQTPSIDAPPPAEAGATVQAPQLPSNVQLPALNVANAQPPANFVQVCLDYVSVFQGIIARQKGLLAWDDLEQLGIINRKIESLDPNLREPVRGQFTKLLADVTQISCAFETSSIVGGSGYLTDALKLCPKIQSLHLICFSHMTEADAQAIGALADLQELNLSACADVTDVWLEKLAELTSLQKLDLSYCKNITGAGLQHLSKLTSLRDLDLSGCYQISMKERWALRHALPTLRIQRGL